jgi:hypothetical protein
MTWCLDAILSPAFGTTKLSLQHLRDAMRAFDAPPAAQS